MSYKATKIGGASVLTILGVVCLGTFLIAAFAWSTYTTESKGPQEVSLGVPTLNQWDESEFFTVNTIYEITLPVTYNFHGATQISYSIEVVASAGQGTIESLDFLLSISGISGADLSESSAGTWTTGTIIVQNSTPSDEITITIMTKIGAMDLSQVSFAISAQSVA